MKNLKCYSVPECSFRIYFRISVNLVFLIWLACLTALLFFSSGQWCSSLLLIIWRSLHSCIAKNGSTEEVYSANQKKPSNSVLRWDSGWSLGLKAMRQYFFLFMEDENTCSRWNAHWRFFLGVHECFPSGTNCHLCWSISLQLPWGMLRYFELPCWISASLHFTVMPLFRRDSKRTCSVPIGRAAKACEHDKAWLMTFTAECGEFTHSHSVSDSHCVLSDLSLAPPAAPGYSHPLIIPITQVEFIPSCYHATFTLASCGRWSDHLSCHIQEK